MVDLTEQLANSGLLQKEDVKSAEQLETERLAQESIENKRLEEEAASKEVERLKELNKDKTAEQIEADKIKAEKDPDDEEEDNDVEDYFVKLNKKYQVDIKLDDEKSTGIKVQDWIDQYKDTLEKNISDKVINDLFEQRPDLKYQYEGKSSQLVQYKAQINNIKAIEIDVDEDDDEIVAQNNNIAEGLYRADLSTKGVDKEEIEDMIESAKTKGTLLTKGLNSKTNLLKSLERDAALIEREEQEIADNELKLWKETTKEIEKTIKTGFLGVVLPEKEAKEFLKNVIELDSKTGKTKADTKYENLSIDQKLYIDYLIANDFKGAIIPKKTTIKDDLDLNNKRPTSAGKGSNDLKKEEKPLTMDILNDLVLNKKPAKQ